MDVHKNIFELNIKGRSYKLVLADTFRQSNLRTVRGGLFLWTFSYSWNFSSTFDSNDVLLMLWFNLLRNNMLSAVRMSGVIYDLQNNQIHNRKGCLNRWYWLAGLVLAQGKDSIFPKFHPFPNKASLSLIFPSTHWAKKDFFFLCFSG